MRNSDNLKLFSKAKNAYLDGNTELALRTYKKAFLKYPELRFLIKRTINLLFKNKEFDKEFKINYKIRELKKIAFYLPAVNNGGGVHSVIQEAIAINNLNINTKVLINEKHLRRFLNNYPNQNIEDILIPTNPSNFEESVKEFDILIGTVFSSARVVSDISKKFPFIMPAYYIQDYEPMFYEENSSSYLEALKSYNLNSNMICFAKTDWICNIVKENHNLTVNKVKPSLDKSIFNLDKILSNKKIIISAMIRPGTPRRGATRTMNLLSAIKKKLSDDIKIIIFGCKEQDKLFLKLNRDFEFENRGILIREEVAKILKISSVFIDLSDYQAFGRTGLESMACGCAPILPSKGGCNEYAINNLNSFLINTTEWEKYLCKIINLLTNREKLIEMQNAAIKTSFNYSTEKAAKSELSLLTEKYKMHQLKQNII